MQILLTEDEYKRLLEKAEAVSRKHREDLQKACTLAADHAPPGKGLENFGKTWGCILSKRASHCDGCPVISLCPNPDKDLSQ